MIDTIFVDIDDVLNEFTMRAMKYLGCNVNISNFNDWPVDCVAMIDGVSKIAPIFNKISEHAMWGKFYKEFWAALPISDLCNKLLKECQHLVGQKNVFLLTRPTDYSSCAAGKVEWIQRNLPGYSQQYFIGHKKAVIANQNNLLIDDNEINCESFKKRGGYAILVPRPWNNNRDRCITHTENEYVLAQLTDLKLNPGFQSTT